MSVDLEQFKVEFGKLVEQAGGFRSTVLGNTLYVYTGDNAAQVEAEIVKKAIRTGETILRDHYAEYYEWVEVFDSSKSGSDCYVWHKDGNRIKHHLVQTISRNGVREKHVLRAAFRKPEAV